MIQQPAWELYSISSLSCAPSLRYRFPDLYADMNHTNQISVGCRNYDNSLLLIPSLVNGQQVVAFSGAIGWGEVDDNESFCDDDADFYEAIFADGIKVIEEYAFSKCEKLRIVRLPPNSLRYIGSGAFSDCFSLQKITLNGHLIGLGTSAFEGCISLQRIKIPGSVKKIPMSCFSSCCKLQQVIIEEGVEEIDILAFFNCAEICRIVLPSTIKNIHEKAFAMTPAILVVHEGSYAHQWAISHGCNFELNP